MCQNFLLTAICNAFHVFFSFMLPLLFQNPLMIITHIIKLNMLYNLKTTKKETWHSKFCVEVAIFQMSPLEKFVPFFRSSGGCYSYLSNWPHIFGTQTPEEWESAQCPAAGEYVLPMDSHSPTVQLKGADPSYGVALQPSFVSVPHSSLMTWTSAC